MTPAAILGLTDALAQDQEAGLIQSFPQLIGARTLFARAQQFANSVYGTALAAGLARWTGQEGNYWGHNAIIRISAFAGAAGLPKIKQRNGADALILSHDFVEAGLLRRAGWAVRFMPQITGSYEETPPTLIDHIQRDRRWCAGNLQHLRLLFAKGFHPVSRFHLFSGAMGYLVSPVWLVLLLIWALVGPSEDQSVIAYFSPDMPMRPSWPEMPGQGHFWLMAGVYAALLAPKGIGALVAFRVGLPLSRLGGGPKFAGSVALELLVSILYAPVLMVQHTRIVLAVALGLKTDWVPQDRSGRGYDVLSVCRMHWIETLLGVGLFAGLATGVVSLWLTPIAISLLGAVPLSLMSAWPLRVGGWMTTPQEMRAPPIVAAVARWRRSLSATPGE